MKRENLLVVIDMNNGFAKEGNLYSQNVEKKILPIRKFVRDFKTNNGKVAYYSDAHDIEDEEFKMYPLHCLKGTKESEFVDELKGFEDFYIEKNTTDGFYAKNPMELLKGSEADIYVCGCVTDICVYNFVCSLLGYVKQNNLNTRVIVLEDLVATFDGVKNDASRRHDDALYIMHNEGADIINSSTLFTRNSKKI